MSHNWYVRSLVHNKKRLPGKDTTDAGMRHRPRRLRETTRRKKTDLTKLDNDKRGCLQLAEQVQGKGQTLANWLKGNVANIPSSDGKGRAKEDQRRGEFSQKYRQETGPPQCKGNSGGGECMSHNESHRKAGQMKGQGEGSSKWKKAMSHNEGPQAKRQRT